MQHEEEKELVRAVIKISRCVIYITTIALTCLVILIVSLFNCKQPAKVSETTTANNNVSVQSISKAAFTRLNDEIYSPRMRGRHLMQAPFRWESRRYDPIWQGVDSAYC